MQHEVSSMHVQKQSPDDELVCSKHVQEIIFETNEGNKVCILFVLLTYMQGVSGLIVNILGGGSMDYSE
jgi:hypothetical protein